MRMSNVVMGDKLQHSGNEAGPHLEITAATATGRAPASALAAHRGCYVTATRGNIPLSMVKAPSRMQDNKQET